jgi:hypothetical protein
VTGRATVPCDICGAASVVIRVPPANGHAVGMIAVSFAHATTPMRTLATRRCLMRRQQRNHGFAPLYPSYGARATSITP